MSVAPDWFAAPAPAVEHTGPPRASALIVALAAATALVLAPLVPAPVHLLGYAVGAWVTSIAAALFRRADAQKRQRRRTRRPGRWTASSGSGAGADGGHRQIDRRTVRGHGDGVLSAAMRCDYSPVAPLAYLTLFATTLAPPSPSLSPDLAPDLAPDSAPDSAPHSTALEEEPSGPW